MLRTTPLQPSIALDRNQTSLTKQGKGEESLGPAILPADSCRTAGIEEMGLHRNRQFVVASNKLPRVGTALP